MMSALLITAVVVWLLCVLFMGFEMLARHRETKRDTQAQMRRHVRPQGPVLPPIAQQREPT